MEYGSNAISYSVRGQALGDTSWFEFDVYGSTSYEATGLSNTSNYQWQVQSNCDYFGFDVSNYTNLDTFQLSIATCFEPTNVKTKGVTSTRLSLSGT